MGFTWYLDIRVKNKMAEVGRVQRGWTTRLPKYATFSVFGFEKLNTHQEEAIQQIIEMKSDVYANLPTG